MSISGHDYKWGATCDRCGVTSGSQESMRPCRRDGWQPIASAPKDGTLVLCYGDVAGEISGEHDNAEVFVARWSGSGDYPGYEWVVDPGDGYCVWGKPTHWFPIPDTPQKDRATV